MRSRLSRLRQLFGGLDERIVPAALGLGLIALVILAMFRGTQNIEPEVVKLTIEAAATQTNAQVPTLASNLTLTPPEAALTGAAPTLALSGRQEVRQFAASATASSQLGDEDFSAIQAVGEVNTTACGNSLTAWAPAEPQSSLTLYYAQLVTPTGLEIHQTNNPGFITRVTLTDIYGEVHAIYEAIPGTIGICPYPLVLPIGYIDDPVSIVTLYIDQSGSAGLTQIDAVELIGIRY